MCFHIVFLFARKAVIEAIAAPSFRAALQVRTLGIRVQHSKRWFSTTPPDDHDGGPNMAEPFLRCMVQNEQHLQPVCRSATAKPVRLVVDDWESLRVH